MSDSHRACIGCAIIESGLECDAAGKIDKMAQEKGLEADFNYCVFNRMAKKLKLHILRKELDVDMNIDYRRKTG